MTRVARGEDEAGPRPPGRRRAVALSAVGCALAALAALLAPAALDGPGERGRPAPERRAAPPARDAEGAAHESCERPEASLRPSPDSGPAVRRIKARASGKLIAGVDQNSYRWGYRDPATGDLTGFDIELVRAIAEEIFGDRDAVVFRTIPTNQRVPALRERKVDIVVRTMTINCDRVTGRNKVAFSTAYFQAGQQLLVPRDSPITSYGPTLRGKRVCTAKGSTGEQRLDDERRGTRSLGATKVTVPNQLDCLVRLQLGQVDAVFTDSALAAGQAAQDPSVKLVGEPVTREPYGVAMHSDDTDLVRRVNKVLEDYRRGGADSPWMRAYREWLQDDLPGVKAPPKPVYKD
ncbi:glutamate ABC transporter substrate-binding protein [Streptomyces sp. 71268]|uniref:glutamate ABC transporter substrate-binding protein n=1 Tax=Streptomyces sp. 71268 TaxID=3002640 RepID=UPI0023F882C1|nr:glutamate ABC transporter substrate-binding protein [Streptomyces sp. 71268]WEV27814.1 glutamate ABC transporter substrate-binding protein [Streptomyces sp. 71268]